MPTILLVQGWRFFFYANELNEPIHIHAVKGEMSCKYWLDLENFDIIEEYINNLNNKEKRQVREIIFNNFHLIENEWNKFNERRNK
jgi:hypothetical protein